MILPAQAIRDAHIFEPFNERTIFNGVSYGLSSAGYDIRIAEDLTLLPKGHALASAMEHFNMPNDVLGQCADKSTWARKFLTVQNTIIEPGWKGYLTLELINHSNKRIFIEKGTAIAQIILMRLEQPTEQPYSGKYQNQKEGPAKAILEDNGVI